MKYSLLTLLLITTTIAMLPACGKKGCTSIRAINYDPDAKRDDGTCRIVACTDAAAANFDPTATEDDATCEGCTDPDAPNYSPSADIDDGTCEIGHVVFHVSPLSNYSAPVAVFVDGEIKGEILAKLSSATCDYHDEFGELTVKMPPGSYPLAVGDPSNQVASVSFQTGGCGQFMIQ